MIISVDELKQYIEVGLNDKVLESELLALESSIRKYTNNNFQNIYFRYKVNASNGKLILTDSKFKVGDTIQISQSKFNDGLYVVTLIDDGIVLDQELYDEEKILVTKVVYPQDIKMGVVSLMKWILNNRDKVGIQSETISRHSVTYFNMDADNSIIGFPKSLVGFLKPYMKARFD